MKRKLKKNIMEKKNWIKESIEFLREAMNKGSIILSSYFDEYSQFIINKEIYIAMSFEDNKFVLTTPKGKLDVPYEYSERDKLEIKAMHLTVQEYKEDMAISEFEHYFKTDDEPKTVNDLDDDDE